jgi:hypothetical protein
MAKIRKYPNDDKPSGKDKDSWNRSGYRCYKNYLIDDIV